jgi:hypothetical protein
VDFTSGLRFAGDDAATAEFNVTGCAPKTSKGASSAEFGVGFIGSVNGVTIDKNNFWRLLGVKIVHFSGAKNVMTAMHLNGRPESG